MFSLGGSAIDSPTPDAMEQELRRTLPREARLRGHDAFGRIFRQSDGLRRGELVVKYRPAEDPSLGVRAGFVVRRNAGSTPRRNRLRRLLREAYRLERARFIGTLPAGIGLDLVILWSGSPEEALRPDFEAINGRMRSALGAISSRLRKRADGTEREG